LNPASKPSLAHSMENQGDGNCTTPDVDIESSTRDKKKRGNMIKALARTLTKI